MAKVLILEQSKSMRNTLRERLEFEGFATAVALRLGDHVLANDIEHSAPCEGEDEGQRGGGEAYSPEA